MTTARVLLVDDVRIFLEFERPFFERAGCVILTASTGTEALRIAREESPHIVLLDYEMPGMNGDEVCRKIKEDPATRHIPVLIVTSHREPAVLERCQRAGCTDFVTKPVTGRELLEKVVRILQMPYRVHMRTRVSMEVSVGLGSEAVSILGYSEDISESGMRVESMEPVDTGASVGLSFTIPTSGVRVQAQGVVVRVSDIRSQGTFAVAVRFEGSDPAFSEAIRSFVEQEVGR
ncbi:MAG TPA: response regulator [Candidatus Polarisedimenticolia bacterium]|jgi:CheY-like chemotaxis protein